MQAIKMFFVVSAIAVIAASPDLRADDAQLREALRKATSKAGGETSAEPPAKLIPPVAPAPAAKPAPPVTKAVPAPAAPAVQASKPLSADQAATLKSALRQQSGQPAPAVAAAPVAKTAPAPVEQPAVASVPPAQGEPTPVATENADALRGALHQKAGEIEPRPAPATSSAPAFGAAAPAAAFAPLEAPASPIPASKEQRLADLLRLYKANVITPADYHNQRAAILAE